MDNWGRELSGLATNTLSDKAIRAALKKATDAAKPSTINDGDVLSLIARPDGAGWWRLRYWLESRENRLSLGTYPDVSLADARVRRDAARELIAAGTDPSEARKADKATRQRHRDAERLADAGLPPEGSFEAVAREWLTTIHNAKTTEGHSERIRMEQDLFPWVGRRPIGEIDAPELLACLRRVEARGAIETAHRVKNAAGQVFRYGIATGRCTRDPAADLRDALAPVHVKHHAAITDPKRVGELLRAIASYKGHCVTRAALQLAPLVFQRPGELRMAECVGAEANLTHRADPILTWGWKPTA